MVDDQAEVTTLLRAWCRGDESALERLTPLVYAELRRRARGYLRGERTDHTLQSAALVNEVYLRMVKGAKVDWNDRSHFFVVAARCMRRVLVDAARAHRYQKRGGGALKITFDEGLAISDRAPNLIVLDAALAALAATDARKARVVELRFFGGMSNEEIASALDISTDTVTRDWQMARLWLRRAMKKERTVDH